ncbi:MAG: methyltransferase domain-containing protein [Hyphomicrobiales bacterium]|nr:methyltransferase domain-containing protein [Hyphomicrobiales bacterium]
MNKILDIELEDLPPAAQGPILFLGRTLKNPMQVCSLFPSSPFVGRAMTWAIADRPETHVIELGGGTGAVTRQLLRSGLGAENLTVLEIDSLLGGHLRRTFPDLDVVIAPAQDLAGLWRERNGPPVGAIVSTLPMRLFKRKMVRNIMRNCVSVLAPGGVFVQFTYRQDSPVPEHIARSMGLSTQRRSRVWVNLPPAGIWVYRKPLGRA